MTFDDCETAFGWLRQGRDPEFIAETLGVSVEAVEALRSKNYRLRFTPTPTEIPRLAAAVRAKRTGPSGQHEPSAEGVAGPAVRQCVPSGYGWDSVG